jgi:hypothetical protein
MISEYVKKIELSQRKRVAEDGANYNFLDGFDY